MRTPSILIYLLLLVFPVLFGQPIAYWLAEPLAERMQEQKMAEIKQANIERYKIINEILSTQLKQFEFNCGAKDMALLRNPRFYNTHIRLQGLELGSGQVCSSLGQGISIAISPQPDDIAIGPFGLTATPPGFNTEQELVVYYRATNGNIAYWVLDNSWIHEILQTPCADCFYLEFNLINKDSYVPMLPRGDKRIKQEPGPNSIDSYEPNTLTKQTLWAGQALTRYARAQAETLALWIGVALGILLAGAYWLHRHYQRSLQGLLQIGLKNQEFEPFYQPVVDSRTGEVVGFEALLRWRRRGELVPPGAFIDYIEEQGLILPITAQLLERVLTDLSSMAATQWVSVNLVAAHVEQPLLRNLLQQHQWPSPAQLTFELTERKPLTDIKSATSEINALQERGYHIKLDDFGTGYGGFAYLQSLGIRQIKIDKMFVDTIGTDDLKRSVLDAIIAFGRESGMEMIAEGVETREQVDYLYRQGVYLIQGYVFGKPMPLQELLLWQQAFRQPMAETA
ncbi:EAL domain-containing protein [Aeromonas sp. L_1B5_3]|uniref:EAL domain-containing protein n=1 Tax=Aeromonas sp. L_1B5_3 TaxID=1588629 RepID=UPI0005B6F5EB|nr:EAL domain-containing protein [Aeromonas sp. L_1B5_3]KIQ80216.1 diguanylate phosphodiesterase [Aeromonas sp. L_1B5_3]